MHVYISRQIEISTSGPMIREIFYKQKLVKHPTFNFQFFYEKRSSEYYKARANNILWSVSYIEINCFDLECYRFIIS